MPQKYRPADTARALVDRARRGDLVTRGQWVEAVERIDALPVRLSEWVWSEMVDIVGSEGVRYLRDNWSRTPGGEWEMVPA